MELAFKPDLDDALARWRAFWNNDLIGRPCCAVTAPLDGVERVPSAQRQILPTADFDDLLGRIEAHMATVYYAGEAMPSYQPSFGPDQMAAFVGGELEFSGDSESTTWSRPFVASWDDALPLELGAPHDTWERMLTLLRLARARGEGKFLVGHLDLHSNYDLLAAIRGPDRLCIDLLDDPAAVRRAMAEARRLFPIIYDRIYEAAGMAGRGTTSWLPYYSEGRFNTVQCDFCCLLSPSQFGEFVLPALTEECDYLDRSVYHYDGPEALQHFDAITGIGSLDGVQWTPGARNRPMIEWIDLLKRIQARGKSVYISCTFDELKVFHRELEPNLVFYSVGVKTQAMADEILAWLERNT